MPQPPTGPFTHQKEPKINSALYGGYLIRDGSRRVIAAVPGSVNYSAEGVALLLVAGANHLPGLLRLADAFDLVDDEDLFRHFPEARHRLSQFLDAMDRARLECPL